MQFFRKSIVRKKFSFKALAVTVVFWLLHGMACAKRVWSVITRYSLSLRYFSQDLKILYTPIPLDVYFQLGQTQQKALLESCVLCILGSFQPFGLSPFLNLARKISTVLITMFFPFLYDLNSLTSFFPINLREHYLVQFLVINNGPSV